MKLVERGEQAEYESFVVGLRVGVLCGFALAWIVAFVVFVTW